MKNTPKDIANSLKELVFKFTEDFIDLIERDSELTDEEYYNRDVDILKYLMSDVEFKAFVGGLVNELKIMNKKDNYLSPKYFELFDNLMKIKEEMTVEEVEELVNI